MICSNIKKKISLLDRHTENPSIHVRKMYGAVNTTGTRIMDAAKRAEAQAFG